MAYLRATRYGLTKIDPSDTLHEAGWRQVWQHPSGMLAMRHPSTGRWVVASTELTIDDAGWCSSLRGAARKIEQRIEAR